jgi:diaminopimelate epimerase
MEFVKMQIVGNDFVLVDAMKNKLDKDFPELAKMICDRCFGVGASGLIVIQKSANADFLINVFKQDGSEPRVSANSIMCASKYLRDSKIIKKDRFKAETKAKIIDITVEGDTFITDIGEPELESKKIPVVIDKDRMINEQLKLKDRIVRVTCMSLGNPHCVRFVDKLSAYDVAEEGALIENHEEFPRKTNVEFIEVINDSEIKMRPWKRSVGEAFGAGTGACAALVACVLNNKTGRKIIVHAKGGDVEAEWKEDNNHVTLKAKPRYIFKGEIEI